MSKSIKLLRYLAEPAADGRLLLDSAAWRRLPAVGTSCEYLRVVRRLAEVETDGVSIAIGFGQMVALFVAMQALLLLRRKQPKQLAAFGMIGAHIVGFSALEAFYPLQLIEPFSTSPGLSFIVVIIGCSALGFMTFLGAHARDFVVGYHAKSSRRLSVKHPDDSATPEVTSSVERWKSEEEQLEEQLVAQFEELWHEQCVKAEDEFFAFATGFLISVSIRYFLMGCTPQLHWIPVDTGDVIETWGLLGAALACSVLLLLSALAKPWAHGRSNERTCLERAATLLEQTMSMTMGWLVLFWGYWQFWNVTDAKGLIGNGDVMIAKIVLALIFTCFAFVMIIVIDYAADRLPKLEDALRSLGEAFVLLLGLSWESCFMEVMGAVLKNSSDEVVNTLVFVCMSAVLCLLVIPAWIMYILPNALGHGHCQEDDADDEEHGEKDLADIIEELQTLPKPGSLGFNHDIDHEPQPMTRANSHGSDGSVASSEHTRRRSIRKDLKRGIIPIPNADLSRQSSYSSNGRHSKRKSGRRSSSKGSRDSTRVSQLSRQVSSDIELSAEDFEHPKLAELYVLYMKQKSRIGELKTLLHSHDNMLEFPECMPSLPEERVPYERAVQSAMLELESLPDIPAAQQAGPFIYGSVCKASDSCEDFGV
eukprot:TRINITY_DN64143_c0_g1_i1.p1 TRINITY_DN64143_c0_g1~~TRINITY_DN64143_c0_g1_i1.p1  ORF type:complete len:745 (+),score=145.50 TRINITY_DN64143_c0_g1_i1:289-2235(+)